MDENREVMKKDNGFGLFYFFIRIYSTRFGSLIAFLLIYLLYDSCTLAHSYKIFMGNQLKLTNNSVGIFNDDSTNNNRAAVEIIFVDPEKLFIGLDDTKNLRELIGNILGFANYSTVFANDINARELINSAKYRFNFEIHISSSYDTWKSPNGRIYRLKTSASMEVKLSIIENNRNIYADEILLDNAFSDGYFLGRREKMSESEAVSYKAVTIWPLDFNLTIERPIKVLLARYFKSKNDFMSIIKIVNNFEFDFNNEIADTLFTFGIDVIPELLKMSNFSDYSRAVIKYLLKGFGNESCACLERCLADTNAVLTERVLSYLINLNCPQNYLSTKKLNEYFSTYSKSFSKKIEIKASELLYNENLRGVDSSKSPVRFLSFTEVDTLDFVTLCALIYVNVSNRPAEYRIPNPQTDLGNSFLYLPNTIWVDNIKMTDIEDNDQAYVKENKIYHRVGVVPPKSWTYMSFLIREKKLIN